jgi:hypothetical protein
MTGEHHHSVCDRGDTGVHVVCTYEVNLKQFVEHDWEIIITVFVTEEILVCMLFALKRLI